MGTKRIGLSPNANHKTSQLNTYFFSIINYTFYLEIGGFWALNARKSRGVYKRNCCFLGAHQKDKEGDKAKSVLSFLCLKGGFRIFVKFIFCIFI